MLKHPISRPTAFEALNDLSKECRETREEMKRIEGEIKESRRRFWGNETDKEEKCHV